MTQEEIAQVRDLRDQANEMHASSQELESIAYSYKQQSDELATQAKKQCTHPSFYIEKDTWGHRCGICGKYGRYNPGIFGDKELHFGSR
ncbi:hypothetical protein NVP2275O_197 [Vibrio phage 2.275.O._10N.286.54.E11]|nr:hypothetical protein NVP2275O_197 [Vibrio phage 2.275.O._10N.286.54.E11]